MLVEVGSSLVHVFWQAGGFVHLQAVADDFDVSYFLTDTSAPHSILTKQKTFHQKAAGRATGTQDQPLEVADDDKVPHMRSESSDEEPDMSQIPLEGERKHVAEDAVSVSDASDKQSAGVPKEADGASDRDDKKQLGLTTAYNGFKIYGRILCLIVKRTGGTRVAQQANSGGGKAMMEEWIASTQTGGTVLDDGSYS